jgi:hypothetical protein
MDRMETIEANVAIMLGRLNGMHAVVLTVLREMPKPVASAAARALGVARQKVEADAVASPIPEATLHEMLAVIDQARQVLSAAANS